MDFQHSSIDATVAECASCGCVDVFRWLPRHDAWFCGDCYERENPDPVLSRGGIIKGPALMVRLERVGSCLGGHCLYSINGADPEHIVPSALIGTDEGRAMLVCPSVVHPG